MEPINPLWTLLASTVAVWLGYRIGYRQATIAAKSLALNIKRARPHIGSRAELRKTSPPTRPDIVRYSIYTTIYNDGDFVARKVEGEWNLLLMEGKQPIPKRIIRVDSLSSGYPWETEYELPGGGNFAFYDRPEYIFQVDVDLTYLGLDDEPQRYRRRYRYDRQQKAMIPEKVE